MRVDFITPFLTGNETEYVRQVLEQKHLAGDGPFSKRCHAWLTSTIGTDSSLITPSGTAALELSALLVDVQPHSEVIMPSFTFTSTANAFVLRGCKPVFVDIRADTQNIDESLIEAAITDKTAAIMVVHYGGVSCEMDTIVEIGARHGIPVLEDAAHALLATYKGEQLGSIGSLAALSFHETKNMSAGEGGALLVNDSKYSARAEIVREKGTNRTQFFRGQVDKYTWVDIGSSYLPSELQAAFLYAQLEQAQEINRRRVRVWDRYHGLLEPLEQLGVLRRPVVPPECTHNGHMYYIIVESSSIRQRLIEYLRKFEVSSVFHYVPLHSSPAGLRYARIHDTMKNTDRAGDGLLRLPMWPDLQDDAIEYVVDLISKFFKAQRANDENALNIVSTCN
jgi:dTDP-4-amino-4,6-dideoxygalactose transaminase